jgi:diguanylate cyclase (GGDEF)-like protein
MIVGTYNLWLVLCSLLISMFASYTAINMASRVSASKGRTARWWLIGGSTAMGIGIWSMHFVGMLALKLPMQMSYDPLITFLSFLLAVASSAFALWVVCRERLSWVRVSTGAVLMGSGICAMHYAGIAAMHMHPVVRYKPVLFLLSVAIAITASGAALWIAFRLRRQSSKIWRVRAGAATVMGLAIAGMHYTGMAAAEFPKNSACEMIKGGLSPDGMAPLIILVAFGVLSAALAISMLDFRASILASSLANAQQELYFLAMHDALTKLPNRTLLEDRLNQEFENAKRNHKPFSVLFLDLDGFKKVNDAFGHQAGDSLLIQVADRLRSIMRGRDTVARLGGDEFVLLADTSERLQADALAEKLIAAIQKPFAISGFNCVVSASIGIALYKEQAGPQALLKQADAAMYQAKARGRNTYCFYDESMNEDAQEQLQIIHDLRSALARKEFLLHYQPKFDAHSGAMLGVEALIRWKHPVRGILSPADFIPHAERTGLILPIGEWTIQEACRQMHQWQKAGHSDFSVAVNLSAVQFSHPGLFDVVCQNLKHYSLDPSCLAIEITESTAMRDPKMSLSILQKLNQLGVRISIDDFGTGYSSLLYLKRLPASELKIDCGFVPDLLPGSEDAAIISAMVALGRKLNLEVVAEGVESAAQQKLLRSLGCSSLQGFLLGRPMPPEELIAARMRERTAIQAHEEAAA